MIDLSLGSPDLEAFMVAREPLDGLPTLQKFILAYANISPNGQRLTKNRHVLEALMFSVWLEACAAEGLSPANPNNTAEGKPL